jgi:hypothetical protein
MVARRSLETNFFKVILDSKFKYFQNAVGTSKFQKESPAFFNHELGSYVRTQYDTVLLCVVQATVKQVKLKRQLVSPSVDTEDKDQDPCHHHITDTKIPSQQVVHFLVLQQHSVFAKQLTITMRIQLLLLTSLLYASCSAFQSSLPRFAVPRVRVFVAPLVVSSLVSLRT